MEESPKPWSDNALAIGDGDDVLHMILTHLGVNARDLSRAMAVCRSWRATTKIVVQRLCLYRFGRMAYPIVATKAVADRQTRATTARMAPFKPTCCAWHPTNGHLFVVGFANGAVRSYHAGTWAEQQAHVQGHAQGMHGQAPVTHLAFSRTGDLALACWANGLTVLFECESMANALREVPASAIRWPGAVTWGEFAPSAPSAAPLVLTCNRLVTVWESDTKSVTWEHSPGASSCCLTLDGAMSATATRRLLIIHDFCSREVLHAFNMTDISSLAWAPTMPQRLLIGRRRSPSFMMHMPSCQVDGYVYDGEHTAKTKWTPDGRAILTDPDGFTVGEGDDRDMVVAARSASERPQVVTGLAVSPDSRACVVLLERREGGPLNSMLLVYEL